ncbi:MAG TPA: hypothetical protein VHH12_12320 [Mycobacterium sp.]|nr:hypothetical protein [Mycobacterium sp.]
MSACSLAGLTDDHLAAINDGNASDALNSAVIAAVDELHTDTRIGDTSCTLGEHLGEPQLMDLMFTPGGYATLALAIEVFGIEDKST